MIPVIYYRQCRDLDDLEITAMCNNFRCVTSRLGVQKDELCISRYSALPYYRELEQDINSLGARMINTYRQHRYIADLGDWSQDFEGITPETWSNLDMVPDSAFPVIVKGETNSKKFQWDTHFFAKTRRDAVDVMCRLQEDGFISDQWIYFRRFVPLKTYTIGLRGVPISKEFRVFICRGNVLSRGYYWSSHVDDLPDVPDANEIPKALLDQVIERVGKSADYYTVDVAQTEKGEWIVIELNDGQQSGLSENDPNVLYSNLAKVLRCD